jgi:hypothetical protein
LHKHHIAGKAHAQTGTVAVLHYVSQQVPIGGAGAQKKFVEQLVIDISKHVKAGKAQLYLNSGDRGFNHKSFSKLLDKVSLKQNDVCSTSSTAVAVAVRLVLL